TAALHGLDHSFALAFSHPLQHLGVWRPYRDDHAATLGELLDQAFGKLGSSGGDKDRVVGCVFRPAATAVSHIYGHVSHASAGKGWSGVLGEGSVSFDGVHFAGEQGE